jgi:hypothetical protein
LLGVELGVVVFLWVVVVFCVGVVWFFMGLFRVGVGVLMWLVSDFTCGCGVCGGVKEFF